MMNLDFGTLRNLTLHEWNLDFGTSRNLTFHEWNLHFGTSRNLTFHEWNLHFGTSRNLTFHEWNLDFGTSRNLTFHEWNLHFGTFRNLTFHEWNLHFGTFRNLTFHEWNLDFGTSRNLTFHEWNLHFGTGSIPSEPLGTWCKVSGGCPKPPRSFIGRTPSLSGCWGKTLIASTSTTCTERTSLWRAATTRTCAGSKKISAWSCHTSSMRHVKKWICICIAVNIYEAIYYLHHYIWVYNLYIHRSETLSVYIYLVISLDSDRYMSGLGILQVTHLMWLQRVRIQGQRDLPEAQLEQVSLGKSTYFENEKNTAIYIYICTFYHIEY